MKKNIFLLITLFLTLFSTSVFAGYCAVDDEDLCRYIPFSEITVNGRALTTEQEMAFCEFVDGTYYRNQEDIPAECVDVFASVIPEFSTIAAGVALGGAGIAFMFLRKGEKQ